jgi:putative transposase
VADPQSELGLRLKELAVTRVRYGYRRLDVLLRREGRAPVTTSASSVSTDSRGQQTPKRERSSRHRGERLYVSQPNQTWVYSCSFCGTV